MNNLLYISILMIGSIVFTLIGQVLLKFASFRRQKYFLVAGYLSFFVTVIISMLLMKLIKLKDFNVLNSLNYIVILFASSAIFKEKINKSKFIGTIIIICGVIIFNI